MERTKHRRRAVRLVAMLVAACWLAMVSATASAEESYDPKRAGNPVRIAAYILHPVGVVIDYLIMRPAWWIGHQEPFKTIFGVTD